MALELLDKLEEEWDTKILIMHLLSNLIPILILKIMTLLLLMIVIFQSLLRKGLIKLMKLILWLIMIMSSISIPTKTKITKPTLNSRLNIWMENYQFTLTMLYNSPTKMISISEDK